MDNLFTKAQVNIYGQAFKMKNEDGSWSIFFNPKRVFTDQYKYNRLVGFSDEFWADYLVCALNGWVLDKEQQSKYLTKEIER